MISFVSKPILTSQTIGEQLKKARQGAGLSLAAISARLRIKECYLNAIELGMYSELPGEVYALEFIKKYAQILRLDPKKASKLYKQERSSSENFGQSWHLPHSVTYQFKWPSRIIGKGMMLSGAIAAVIYVLILGFNMLASPTIEIASPARYFETSDSKVVVLGKARSAQELYLNGQALAMFQDGSFSESYSLAHGSHLFRITAVGRFGKKVTEYRVIVIQQDKDENLVLNNE
ncbi:hypothetical protein CL632_01560 [bacterium]|jgi:transcriptional regulator with XRE-family HTH domain|nr:hypothetical protein [bacterium]MDP6571405.1 helix-turn-helix domain-containing protein [Patescibacteria group bacterium]|tara:strand:+ start:13736 stop:14434 length:699 start_codon:yes stop_codon:yes gene_type:complete